MIANTLRTNLAIQTITFATSIMTARVLGPTGRGELALVLLYPQLVANITLLGIDRAVAVMAGHNELSHPIRTIGKLTLLLWLPTTVAAWITINFWISDAHLLNLAKLYLCYIPAVHCFVLLVAMFNGVGDFFRYNRSRLGFYVLNAGFVAIVWSGVSLPLPTLDMVLLANLSSVMCGLLYSIWLVRGFSPAKQVEEGAAARRGIDTVITLGLMFAIPQALAQFNSFAYQIVVEHWLGVTALGIFVVLVSYSRLLSPIGGAVASHIFHLGIAGGQRDIARIFRLSLIVYLFCIAPLLLISPLAIPLIFGRHFVFDTGVVGLLLVSALLSMLADSLAEYLNGVRQVRADIVGRLIHVTTLTLVAVALTPTLGLLAIAMAMASGDLVRCVWLVQQVAVATDCHAICFIRVRRDDITDLLIASRKYLGEIFARG